MSMVIAMTLLSAVVLLPLIWRVIAIRRPLKVAAGGASFDCGAAPPGHGRLAPGVTVGPHLRTRVP